MANSIALAGTIVAWIKTKVSMRGTQSVRWRRRVLFWIQGPKYVAFRGSVSRYGINEFQRYRTPL